MGAADGVGAAGAGAAAGWAAACGDSAAFGAAVCDHALPAIHSETALAKIKPAASRISFPLVDPESGRGIFAFVRVTRSPS